jgi:hypothetical protein
VIAVPEALRENARSPAIGMVARRAYQVERIGTENDATWPVRVSPPHAAASGACPQPEFAAQALQDHDATVARTTSMGDPAFPAPRNACVMRGQAAGICGCGTSGREQEQSRG